MGARFVPLSFKSPIHAGRDSLQSHLTRLHAKAGTKGSSSHSGRRTFAGKVLAITGDMATVTQLLAHSEISGSQRDVDIDRQIPQEMFRNAI